MSWRRIIGPIIFDATITTAAYMEIFNTFVNQLDDEELSIGYFQQDRATSHTPHASMAEIQSFFGNRVISKGLWHLARPIWRRLIISYGDIWKGESTKTNDEPQTPWKQTSPKKFRPWQRTYWQGLSKIWRAGFNPVWTQMVPTSSICYDVVTFLTQWDKAASYFVAKSSLVVKLLKKCRVR